MISGDKSGVLAIWKWGEGSGCVETWTPLDSAAFCLAASPGGAVGVGYQNGAALLLDAAKKEVLWRLAGHEDEIHAIAWHWDPATEENSLMATASKDKTIRIWAPETGRQQKCIKMPKGGGSEGQKQRLWLTLAWVGAREGPRLVSSSAGGHLLLWDPAQAHIAGMFGDCAAKSLPSVCYTPPLYAR